MRTILCVVVALAASTIAAGATAATKTLPKQCGPAIGSKVSPLQIGSIVTKLEKFKYERDEFETSSAYETRMKAIAVDLPREWIVAIPYDVRSESAKYDADTQRLEVSKWFFLNFSNAPGYESIDYGDALYRLKGQPVEYGATGNLEIPMARTIAAKGSYEASNAFGVKVLVQKQKATTIGIFERAGTGYFDNIFFAAPRGSKQPDEIVFSLAADPDKARTLKTTLRAAVVISPKKPYFARGSVYHKGPTRDVPYEIEEEVQVIIADITCAILMDREGAVLGTRATR